MGMVRIAPNGPTVVDIVDGASVLKMAVQIRLFEPMMGCVLRRKMALQAPCRVSVVVNTNGKDRHGPEPRIVGFPKGLDGGVMTTF